MEGSNEDAIASPSRIEQPEHVKPWAEERIYVSVSTSIKCFLEDFRKLLRNLKGKDFEKFTSLLSDCFIDSQNAVELDALIVMVDFYNKNIQKSKEPMGIKPCSGEKNGFIIFHELMMGSIIVARVKSKGSPFEGMSSSDIMRLRAAERRYQKMVKDLHPAKVHKQTFAEIYSGVAMGINSFIGVFLSFLAGYWGSKYIGIKEIRTQLLFGVIFSFCCLFAEILLFVISDAKAYKLASKRLKSKQDSEFSGGLSVPILHSIRKQLTPKGAVLPTSSNHSTCSEEELNRTFSEAEDERVVQKPEDSNSKNEFPTELLVQQEERNGSSSLSVLRHRKASKVVSS